ncbi:radical SAM protein [Bacteroidales bacterium OttesenSCG-928-C19]|nr:radical SAM protein [Bacteroidales bacterium OttesenSCG-928-C19]
MNLFRTIPVFVPELACPNRCTYCNQHLISGQLQMPAREEIVEKIETYLATFPANAHVEVGFFGGNFTGIETEIQESLLQIVQPYIRQGKIHAIRLSTRPDYIDEERLMLLKNYGVKTIELGVQSTDNEVLSLTNRGYDTQCVEKASNLIRAFGFDLGLQMMIGLPGDTKEKSIQTAKKIIELGASQTRIYPTLVIEGTELAAQFLKGEYKPLSLEEAIDRTKEILLLFEKHNVTILRVGLHPTEGFISGKDFLAGPFHVSFKELVLTEIWHDLLKDIPADKSKEIIIEVPEKELNYAVGYQGKNKKFLEERFKKIKFIGSQELLVRDYDFW